MSNLELRWCGGSEVRIIAVAGLSCRLPSQSHTGFNKLLESFRFRRSQAGTLRNNANFGIRTLESYICWWSFDSSTRKSACREGRRVLESDHQKEGDRHGRPQSYLYANRRRWHHGAGERRTASEIRFAHRGLRNRR